MMRTTIDPFLSALDLAEAIRRKEVSPLEVADCFLQRMDTLDFQLNAFCHRADDDVRAAAYRATEAIAHLSSTSTLPPFHGVPLPIKDLAAVAGWPTSYGSAGASKTTATKSDPVVQRFVDAGFILLGKTTTSEFGTVPFTENEALGISRNPWDPNRTPGGSSSGAGIAVAAGMAPIAHGADGGASIRVPASCNGLVGLKATRGLITNDTVEIEGLATSGVLTRTVGDSAAALDVLAKHDPAAWWSPPSHSTSFLGAVEMTPPPGLRIGVLDESPLDGIRVDPACKKAVDTAARLLESAGHQIVDTPLPLPPADELIAAFMVIWNLGGAGIPLAHPERVEPHNLSLRNAAKTIDSWSYAEGLKRAQQLSRRVIEEFTANFDLLITPTMACLPPPIGAWRLGTDEEPLMALINCYPMAVFTSLFNVTGQPAISVPIHHDGATDLPVGVQLVALPWREELLLQMARRLEVSAPWSDRRPVIR